MQIVRMAESDTIKGRGRKGQPESDSCAAKMAGAACGLAVDIGTTTVVMGLYDLDSGERLAGLQEKNSQTLLGADVMMRFSAYVGTTDPGADSEYGGAAL